MPASRHQARMLLTHFALFQFGAALAGGFIGAYLLKSGFSLASALAGYAGYLALRSALRFAALEVVRRAGFARAIVLGTVLIGLQFLPLIDAARPIWFAAWIVFVASGESLYWPVYHATVAMSGESASRGRQLGARTMIFTLVSVIAPLAGAWLLTRSGPAASFGLATASTVLSVLPLLFLRSVPAGRVPSMLETLRDVDKLSLAAFAADGWMSAGLYIAWPMMLFASLGSRYEALGAWNAIAGLIGAAVSYWGGRGIDRGRRDRYLNGVCIMLAAGFIVRGAASWSPVAAVVANLSGAAVTGLYVPVLMSAIYERAKRSGAAFRFHFVAEAGWDAGAVSGCLTVALMALAFPREPSVAILPAMAGIAVVYRCVRADGARLAATSAMPA